MTIQQNGYTLHYNLVKWFFFHSLINPINLWTMIRNKCFEFYIFVINI